MKPESIVFAIAGIFFGVILGWVLGSLNATRAAVPAAPAQQTASTQNGRQTPVLDEARVQALTTIVNNDPKNAGAAVQLGNVYFDAERYDDAIGWYEKALAIDPKNADASTDLGVSYYYTKRPDQALTQFEASLKIDPNHTKTLLNKGIVLAFGKEDLTGAAEVWKKLVDIAPDSPEGQAARRGLEGIEAANKNRAATPSTNQ
jgi:tetratricopeptide (TPR) repeat protein